MEMAEAEAYDVGVIVGRFQVPKLHEAHKALFQHVIDRHKKVLVVLGNSALKFSTKENPLDYEARKQMVLEDYPEVTTCYVKDVNSDTLWSRRLDSQVKEFLTASQSAAIYGGRDSFISHYSGKFPTRELRQKLWISGTSIRKGVHGSSTIPTEDFRRGVIWATANKEPTPYATVDIAIFNDDETELLLGRKPYEERHRFPGGFVDVTDATLEAAARRETYEEMSIEITDPRYVWSGQVDDWRYANEEDGIMTSLFRCNYFSGKVKPADDLADAKWFTIAELTSNPGLVMPVHYPLLAKVLPNTDRK